jgi:uncharacterized protein|tara:strand:- start:883 stop:1179 length:297 start_codon:yes stop_codon:yes gene_type:complete
MKTDEIVIERRNRVTHGEYLVSIGDNPASGRLTWTLRNDARDAEHTVVPPALRGQGIAGRLVEALIEDARSEGFKIIPTCSYVAAQFDRHPEWADLRA